MASAPEIGPRHRGRKRHRRRACWPSPPPRPARSSSSPRTSSARAAPCRAQGGIAAAIDGHDSVEAHLADTLAAGAGLCDVEAVAHICREGPAQVADAAGPRRALRPHATGRLRLAREGAHSAARVVHAGRRRHRRAHRRPRSPPRCAPTRAIELAEGERAREIIVRDGRVGGPAQRRRRRPRARSARRARWPSRRAAWASCTRTPPTRLGATADGPALAARAGRRPGRPGDHPVPPHRPGPRRRPAGPGERGGPRRGRRCCATPTARRFMPDEHPMAELGPRDVVARAIARRAAARSAPT